MSRKLSIIVVFFLLCTLGKAQDIHFSQFGVLTGYLNPAYTGNFNHDYRIAGIHRNQWRSVSAPYSTFGVSGEKATFGKLPLSIGLTVLNDVAGTSNFTTNRIQLPIAFHLAFPDSSWRLSLGLMPELYQQSFSLTSLSFGDQFVNNQFIGTNPTSESFGSLSGMLPNLGTGISVAKGFANGHRLMVGVAYHNLLNPKPIESMEIGAPPKWNFSGSYSLPLSNKWTLTPSFLHSQQAQFQETLWGAQARYTLKKKRYLEQALLMGVFNRFGDAWYPMVGLLYNDWTFGFSYDLNTSGFNSATGYRGAYEVSVVYLIDVFDESFNRFKSCPSFL